MSPTHSDSEDDLDYVPPADGAVVASPSYLHSHSTDSTDHDSGSSDDEQDDVPHATEAIDLAEQKKQRDALWTSFQASVGNPNGTAPSSSPSTARRIKIEKTHLFAGKRVIEVAEVAEDSEDAKKWPRWAPPPSESAPKSRMETPGEDMGGDHEPPPSATPASTPVATVTPNSKRPGPRKPRTGLPLIPKASQAKKISTLDKSAMDWRTHVASQSNDVQDELDINRRGGGYLEKMEFLKRVEERRDDVFDASKARKRRKA